MNERSGGWKDLGWPGDVLVGKILVGQGMWLSGKILVGWGMWLSGKILVGQGMWLTGRLCGLWPGDTLGDTPWADWGNAAEN